METKEKKKRRFSVEFFIGNYGERKDFMFIVAVILVFIAIAVTAFLVPEITINLSFISVIVALFGLIISAFFTYKHDREYRYYIREFRGYMTNLDELLIKASEIIEEAENSIKIAVDFFGIGSVTAKIGHSAYIGSLCKMAPKKDVSVTVIALPPLEAKTRTGAEFPSMPATQQEAEEGTRVEDSTMPANEFNSIEKILENDKRIGKVMADLGVITKSNSSIYFHVFIIDNKKALFYIEEPVKESIRKTIGYITEDPKMLDVLLEMFNRIDTDSEIYKFE